MVGLRSTDTMLQRLMYQCVADLSQEKRSCANRHAVHYPLAFDPDLVHTTYMNKTTSNPYIAQIYAKGRDYVPTPAKMGEFPKTVHGRVFETEEEYREAIAEMLNGM